MIEIASKFRHWEAGVQHYKGGHVKGSLVLINVAESAGVLHIRKVAHRVRKSNGREMGVPLASGPVTGVLDMLCES